MIEIGAHSFRRSQIIEILLTGWSICFKFASKLIQQGNFPGYFRACEQNWKSHWVDSCWESWMGKKAKSWRLSGQSKATNIKIYGPLHTDASWVGCWCKEIVVRVFLSEDCRWMGEEIIHLCKGDGDKRMEILINNEGKNFDKLLWCINWM